MINSVFSNDVLRLSADGYQRLLGCMIYTIKLVNSVTRVSITGTIYK